MGCSSSKAERAGADAFIQTLDPPAAAEPRAIDYADPDEIFRLLRPPADGGLVRVKLLNSAWLLERAAKVRAAKSEEERAALALPCRQVLESEAPEAYFTGDEVEALPRSECGAGMGNPNALAVACASYCWSTPGHPDPQGSTLLLLADAIDKLQRGEGRYDHQRLPTPCAIFLDWTALPQKPGGRERDELERAAFGETLGCMQVWYAHMLTTSVLLTAPIAGYVPYGNRGWPSFERLVSMIAKPNTPMVWPLIVDVGEGRGDCARLAPQTVEQFGALMRTKTFTNGSDCDVVIELYRQTVETVLASAPALKMLFNAHWGDDEMRSVAALLPLCVEVGVVDFQLSFRELTDDGLGALTAVVKAGRVPPKVKKIVFGPKSEWPKNAMGRRINVSRKATNALEAACKKRGIELFADW
mmetsp:Transcript_24296/g.80755  ORF Transcript_24296/g.80755 Transcript_24296/m.80755 type:complete len:415 (+) Transcript_24296:151-1395(+)